MATALKLAQKVWEWLEQYGEQRARNDRRIAVHVEQRRREIVRRTASQIGIY